MLGAGTRAALREWQSARDLEPTGYLTAAAAEVLRSVGEQVVTDSVVAVAEEAQRVSDSIARVEAEAEEAQRVSDSIARLKRKRRSSGWPRLRSGGVRGGGSGTAGNAPRWWWLHGGVT